MYVKRINTFLLRATARSRCKRDYRGPSLKGPSPFGNQAEIIQDGPATISEQYGGGSVKAGFFFCVQAMREKLTTPGGA